MPMIQKHTASFIDLPYCLRDPRFDIPGVFHSALNGRALFFKKLGVMAHAAVVRICQSEAFSATAS